MVEPGLPDELLLLALHDENGSVIRAAAPALHGALVGASLMELSLRDRLSEGTSRQLIADPTPTGDVILDDVCLRIADSPRRQDAAAWVSQLVGEMPDLKDRLLNRMVAAGVLEQREGRILWVYPTRSYPLSDGTAEQHARDRVRAVVLDGQAPDERTAALISLVQACNLLDEVFAPDEREQARRRIAELIAGKPAGGGTFATGLGAGALFAVVGATLYYGYRRLRESFSGRFTHRGSDWAPDILNPWLTVLADDVTSSGEELPTSSWQERSEIGAASAANESSESGSSGSSWWHHPWAGDSGSSGGTSSGSESSSGGWHWWWGSDSSSSDNSNENSSGGSWWDSGSSSSDSGSSSSSWDSGSSWSSDSGSSDSGSSSSSGC